MSERSTAQAGGLVARIRRQVGRREIALLLLVATLAGGAWLFLEIADEVNDGDTVTASAKRCGTCATDSQPATRPLSAWVRPSRFGNSTTRA